VFTFAGICTKKEAQPNAYSIMRRGDSFGAFSHCASGCDEVFQISSGGCADDALLEEFFCHAAEEASFHFLSLVLILRTGFYENR
jgi:hypothetical protein